MRATRARRPSSTRASSACGARALRPLPRRRDRERGDARLLRDAGDTFEPQHYAFLVSEAEFDQIFGRVKERGPHLLGGSGQEAEGRDQYPLRRARRVLRGPGRAPARDHHPALRQRTSRLGRRFLVRSCTRSTHPSSVALYWRAVPALRLRRAWRFILLTLKNHACTPPNTARSTAVCTRSPSPTGASMASRTPRATPATVPRCVRQGWGGARQTSGASVSRAPLPAATPTTASSLASPRPGASAVPHGRARTPRRARAAARPNARRYRRCDAGRSTRAHARGPHHRAKCRQRAPTARR